MNRDTPTQPPSSADDRALEFARRLADVERASRRTTSGLIRALAEAWAESEKAR